MYTICIDLLCECRVVVDQEERAVLFADRAHCFGAVEPSWRVALVAELNTAHPRLDDPREACVILWICPPAIGRDQVETERVAERISPPSHRLDCRACAAFSACSSARYEERTSGPDSICTKPNFIPSSFK